MAVQVVQHSAVERNFVVFPPDVWGPNFLTSLSHAKACDSSIREEHEGLKQDIRMLIQNNTDEPSVKMKLIDITQRLGIAYHFNSEIEDQLNKICNIENSKDQHDLHYVALRFRLLRQQGIKVSCDVFEKFKDGEGKFNESLIQDVEGLLSLYEAAFLSIRGEDILDKALAFTKENLKKILPQLSPNLAENVKHTLNRPIRKCLPRIEARRFIPIYEQEESNNKILLKFAKLDFNMLQEQYKKELNEIIEWWKTLDVKTNFPYVRDIIVSCYFWIMGVYFDPKYYLARKMLTKVIAMASIIDDTYDNYGTYEELVPFTEAIQRWDMETIDCLPECMKLVLHSLNDVYDEIDEIMKRDGRPYCVYYAKESMKRLVRYYLVEAKWCAEKYVPTIEEYMAVATLTGGYPMLATTSFLGMGEIATNDAFEWVSGDPKIVKASAVISRLMDDIVTNQFEQERDHVASSIECYVKQHHVAEEKAIELFRKEIADAWKDMNEECLKPFPVQMDLLERVMNLTRIMEIMYKDDDGYTKSYLMKDYVVSLVQDPLE